VVLPPPTRAPNREIDRRNQLADALSQARLALARHQLDAASEHLSEAARFNRTDDDVTEIANGLLTAYVAEGEGAAAAGDWTVASEHLERADHIALRFGLDDAIVRSTEQKIAAMERFTWLTPDQSTALAGIVGRRVEVHLRSGGVYRGTVGRVERSTLLLDMVREVAGGGLIYVEEIPLSSVARVKVFER
jgi:small nuclear ribonucleoprotein (snRNP)-like protein